MGNLEYAIMMFILKDYGAERFRFGETLLDLRTAVIITPKRNLVRFAVSGVPKHIREKFLITIQKMTDQKNGAGSVLPMSPISFPNPILTED